MLIVSVSDYVKETGSYTQAGPSYKRVFQVDFSEGYSTAGFLHNTDGTLPKYGQKHPDDDNAYVTSVDVAMVHEDDSQQTGSALYTVTYSPLVAGYQLNPLTRPPDIDWGGEVQSEVMYKDLDGTAILNSAKDRYDPMPEREILGGCVTITRNETANPATSIETYSLTTSSDGYGGTADIAKMGVITARKTYENGIPYWQVRYPISFKRDGWRYKVVDNGHRKLTGDGKRRRIHDDVGQTSPVPCLLDGAGGELAPEGSPVVFPTDGYKRYPSVSWSSLSLPNVFA